MASKWKRKGKNKFVMLDRWLFQCAAWRACSPNERCAYLELKQRYDGTNNGRIALSVRDLSEALHVSKDTAGRTLKGLIEKGFIQVRKQSAFNMKQRLAAEYRLTEYGCDVTGELPSKDFMRWQPENNSQSDEKDRQSDEKDSQDVKQGAKHAHGPMRGTVIPLLAARTVR